ncbi:hypothetical protein [Kingella sp. (in: b-proteobacteria)]|uniref:hypothetical protein n=1 Tax=Kingella sp. (in: b-proteobacteria) TaxID=2020713 RepID=UPI0026DB2FD9|nr:hypothetical protein [Kingella sp. (in: b-proteobacteria)]MDO4656802.1 hypothetical protein [Kingella sp. (in: b-proteobacteria)]
MNNEIKLHTNSSVDDIAVDGLSLLDVLNVCNLAIAGLPALVDAIHQGAPRRSLPRMCNGVRRFLAAAQETAQDKPELLAGVKQTAQQFELAAAFAESEISTKH